MLSGRTFGFDEKDSILGRFRRRIKMRESPSIKKKATRGKQEKHGHVTGEARGCGEAEARAAGQKSGTATPC